MGAGFEQLKIHTFRVNRAVREKSEHVAVVRAKPMAALRPLANEEAQPRQRGAIGAVCLERIGDTRWIQKGKWP